MAAPALTHFEKPITLSVSGIVIDEFGDGLSDISVAILIGGILVKGARSDPGGSFEFKDIELDAAIHSIEAQAPGYSSAKESLFVKPELEGKTVNLDLRLESLEVPNEYMETESWAYNVPDVEGTAPTDRRSRFSRVKVFFCD